MLSAKDAVALLERHGLKPSLGSNGITFLRQVATVIAQLEIHEAIQTSHCEFCPGVDKPHGYIEGEES